MEPAVSFRHSDTVLRYLNRLYARDLRQFSFTGGSVADWQAEARPALRRLLGLDAMAEELAGHQPSVELEESEQLEGFSRRLGRIYTEPDWPVEFWLLQPEGNGPFPLAILPHGHSPRGHDIYAGVHHGDPDRIRRIEQRDADVAVQAAKHGFLAIALNTRGFECNCVPDLNARHDGRDCHSELIHALLAGRTAIGERLWDMERALDWASGLPNVDATRVLAMGNSGGGVATSYAAACDERVTVAVPSCSFATYVGENGLAHHCDCNVVPGIYRFGEFGDVAGLTAPRHLLIVNGRKDTLFPPGEVERAVEGVRSIYQAAGVPERFEHRWGPEGHRFYSSLMWPFVQSAISDGTA
ncbi:MAG: hypothetical protein GX131_11235 [candidate division WS1 bacterium]|jgi:dienelactone hydrolase|nr:hypothetical protein [candidate division WS1 bacterium]